MQNLKDIAKAIKLAIDMPKYTEYPRPYLGMSQLGAECPRLLWMYFRWADKITYKARSKRIFNRGDLEEERVFSYWEKIGIKIISRQDELVAANGHIRGHTDGTVTNIPGMEEIFAVGEIKTMAHKYFVPLVKTNDLKKAQYKYYAQAQVYMYFAQRDYTLHSTTNKNDEDIHIEIIPADKVFAEDLVTRAIDVMYSDVPPPKVSTDPTYYLCSWCDFYGVCHLEEKFLKTCRTCKYVSIAAEGNWLCHKHNKMLSLDEQKTACLKYDVLNV